MSYCRSVLAASPEIVHGIVRCKHVASDLELVLLPFSNKQDQLQLRPGTKKCLIQVPEGRSCCLVFNSFGQAQGWVGTLVVTSSRKLGYITSLLLRGKQLPSLTMFMGRFSSGTKFNYSFTRLLLVLTLSLYFVSQINGAWPRELEHSAELVSSGEQAHPQEKQIAGHEALANSPFASPLAPQSFLPREDKGKTRSPSAIFQKTYAALREAMQKKKIADWRDSVPEFFATTSNEPAQGSSLTRACSDELTHLNPNQNSYVQNFRQPAEVSSQATLTSDKSFYPNLSKHSDVDSRYQSNAELFTPTSTKRARGSAETSASIDETSCSDSTRNSFGTELSDYFLAHSSFENSNKRARGSFQTTTSSDKTSHPDLSHSSCSLQPLHHVNFQPFFQTFNPRVGGSSQTTKFTQDILPSDSRRNSYDLQPSRRFITEPSFQAPDMLSPASFSTMSDENGYLNREQNFHGPMEAIGSGDFILKKPNHNVLWDYELPETSDSESLPQALEQSLNDASENSSHSEESSKQNKNSKNFHNHERLVTPELDTLLPKWHLKHQPQAECHVQHQKQPEWALQHQPQAEWALKHQLQAELHLQHQKKPEWALQHQPQAEWQNYHFRPTQFAKFYIEKRLYCAWLSSLELSFVGQQTKANFKKVFEEVKLHLIKQWSLELENIETKKRLVADELNWERIQSLLQLTWQIHGNFLEFFGLHELHPLKHGEENRLKAFFVGEISTPALFLYYAYPYVKLWKGKKLSQLQKDVLTYFTSGKPQDSWQIPIKRRQEGEKFSFSQIELQRTAIAVELVKACYKNSNENRWNSIFSNDRFFLKLQAMIHRKASEPGFKDWLAEMEKVFPGAVLFPWGDEHAKWTQHHKSVLDYILSQDTIKWYVDKVEVIPPKKPPSFSRETVEQVKPWANRAFGRHDN
ncbi:hypothetical protein O181_034907 [Austropuccinia psidii MF-1]|uniref:Uncharacterized protein n=1 Tax=Austropuccinia psidii MF-1 TaxID=1389203 RepID=A0A9Q3H8I4_9BASI|nr:hypothetical protein [Austropuccinia psidii MF-1]